MQKGCLLYSLSIITLLFLLLGGCQEPLQVTGGDLSVSVQTAVQSPGIHGAVRTMQPQFSTAIDEYRISGQGPSSAVFGPLVNDGTSTTIIEDLAVGEWNVTVEGMDTGSNVIARGEKTVQVDSSGSAVTIDVSFLQEATGNIAVDLSWVAAAAIDNIAVSTDGGTTWEQFTPSGTSYTVTKNGIASGFYTLIIKLYAGSDLKASMIETTHVYDYLTTAKIVAQFTEADLFTPVSPTNLQLTKNGEASFDLSWNADAVTTESGFELQRDTDSGFSSPTPISVGINASGYSDSAFIEGVVNYYRLRAVNSFGSSSWVGPTSAALLFAPTGLSANAVSHSQIDLSWTDNSGAEDGYRVERSTSTGGPYTEVTTVGTDSVTYSDTGLSSGTTYFYRVVAANSVTEAVSAEVEATTLAGLEVTIVLETPTEYTVDFGSWDGILSKPSEAVDVTASIDGGGDGYTWYVNGVVTGTTTAGYHLDASTLDIGTYTLMVVITKSGIPYSAEMRFEVRGQ